MNKILKARIGKRFGVFVLLFACFLMMGRSSAYGAQAPKTSVYLPVDQTFTAENTQDKEPEEEVSYSLKALGTDTPMPEGAGENGYIFTLSGSQDVQVGPIEYTHGGVYEYTLSPEISEKEYYTYDTSVYHVKVYVKNTQVGDLTALVVMENGHGEKVDSASFEHNFTGPEPVIETEPETQPQTQPQTEESQSEPHPQKAQIPKTGDVMNLPLWTGILAVSAGVIIFAAVRKKKTQDENTK